MLARSDNKVSALWLSANDATPITANHMTDLFNAATIYGGENPHLASAIPHHTDPT
jgi:hypothetical protein